MDDERRVYYKLTGLGQKALAAELDRYREVVAVAKRKTLFAQHIRLWHMNTRLRDTGTCTQHCFVSIRSRTASAFKSRWSRPSATSVASARRLGEDYSVLQSGYVPKRPRES